MRYIAAMLTASVLYLVFCLSIDSKSAKEFILYLFEN